MASLPQDWIRENYGTPRYSSLFNRKLLRLNLPIPDLPWVHRRLKLVSSAATHVMWHHLVHDWNHSSCLTTLIQNTISFYIVGKHSPGRIRTPTDLKPLEAYSGHISTLMTYFLFGVIWSPWLMHNFFANRTFPLIVSFGSTFYSNPEGSWNTDS